MRRSFSMGMYTVSDVQNNINDAKEIKDILWEKACEHTTSTGSLDYKQVIEITVSDAADIIHALELLIDRLSSIELKKH